MSCHYLSLRNAIVTNIVDMQAVAFNELPDDDDGDRKGLTMYLHLEKFQKDSKQNMSVWIHRMALRFNDPTKPVIAEARFRSHCEELVRYACSEKVPEVIRQTPKKMDLKGSSTFAQYFKKLSQAMLLGADLKGDEFSTVNKCGTWAKAEAERIGEEAKKKEIKEYLKSQGLDEDSEEGRKLLGIVSNDGPSDPLSLALKTLEEKFREHAKYAPDGQSLEMLNKMIRHVDESTAKLIEEVNKATAKKAVSDYC